jgi:hypothetical protein
MLPVPTKDLSTHAAGSTALRRFGIPDDASHWLAKALHPPCGLGPSQMPDRSALPSIYPEFRVTHTVNFATVPGSPATVDLLILKPPGNGTAMITMMGPGGSDFGKAAIDTNILADVVPMVEALESEVRGLTTLSLASPVVPGADQNFYTAIRPELPLEVRKTSSSITVYNTTAPLYNQGTVYATQIPRIPVHTTSMIGRRVATGDSSARLLFDRKTLNFVFNEDQMALLDPKLYIGRAEHGVYQAIKYFGEGEWIPPTYPKGEVYTSSEFTAGQPPALLALPYGPNGWDTVGTLPICTWLQPSTTNSSGVWIHPSNYPDPIRSDAFLPSDTVFDRYATSVILFRGLNPAATLTIKTYDVVESVVCDTSPFRPFVEPPKAYSPRAMELYFHAAQRMANAAPAAENDFGKVWETIKRVAHDVWPVVEKVVPFAIKHAGEAQKLLAAAGPVVAMVPSAKPGVAVKVAAKASGKRKRGGKSRASLV